MIPNLPSYIPIIFAFTTIVTVSLFSKAANTSKRVLFILALCLIIQSVVSLTGVYTITNHLPPRFVLTIWPPLIFIILLFILRRGRKFLDSLNPEMLSYLHTIRIPVEIVLFWLFLQKQIPELM